MTLNNLTYDEEKNIVKYIGSEYQDSKKRMDILSYGDCVCENSEDYQNNLAYVRTINRVLSDCSQDTRSIIMHEFLTNSEANWYLDYYSRGTFYRLKKRAIKEFLRCLKL